MSVPFLIETTFTRKDFKDKQLAGLYLVSRDLRVSEVSAFVTAESIMWETFVIHIYKNGKSFIPLFCAYAQTPDCSDMIAIELPVDEDYEIHPGDILEVYMKRPLTDDIRKVDLRITFEPIDL